MSSAPTELLRTEIVDVQAIAGGVQVTLEASLEVEGGEQPSGVELPPLELEGSGRS